MLSAHIATSGLLALLLCSVLPARPAAAAPDALPQAAAPAQSPLPGIPSWARGPTYHGPNEWKAFAVKQHAKNKALIQKANQAGTKFDFVLYGDSIPLVMADTAKDEWRRLFEGRGWASACLGVAGNDVEDVTWRLISGAEKPKKAPAVLGFLVGTNNLNAHQAPKVTAQRLGYLVEWVQAAFPATEILVVNVLPRNDTSVAAENKALKGMANKHGVNWSTCGSDLDPFNTTLLADGTHPARAGSIQLWRCLQPVVAQLAGKARRVVLRRG